ncbi:binding protein [Wolffia australiana]
MNIVKGVADLLRKTSGGQAGENFAWGGGDKFSAPSTRVHFGNDGDEGVLCSLWQKYETCVDKGEKRKLLQIFLLQFIHTYENWEPEKDFSFEIHPKEDTDGFPEVVRGCSIGHPSEVILILIQELVRIASDTTGMNSDPAVPGDAPETTKFRVEAFNILKSLEIIIRSVHNCRVFSYYGGVQKIIALLKVAVIQLKTLVNAIGFDESLSNTDAEKASFLEKMLLYVISIIFSFSNLSSSRFRKILELEGIRDYFSMTTDFNGRKSIHSKGFTSAACVHWKHNASMMVLEAGGLNWLVELLRSVRRLRIDETGTVLSLQYLTLGSLKSSLLQNLRAQNHFRLIGGLEVLLDALGLPRAESFSLIGRRASCLFDIFQLQILSLVVLRESIFANMNNLQFLCENGRVQKFANSLCWPAFVLQEIKPGMVHSDVSFLVYKLSDESPNKFQSEDISLGENYSSESEWNSYVINLCRALCSFILPPENEEYDDRMRSSARTSIPVSLAYWETSARWMVKILSAVFPSIKACSTGSELPRHLRVFAGVLQNHILYAFRKLLMSIPGLLDALREEGIWNLIFSDNFFYFVPIPEEALVVIGSFIREGVATPFTVCPEGSSINYLQHDNVHIFYMEIISFVEFTATLGGNKHNLPECASLLNALEQSAHNPYIAFMLLRSLHRILQLAFEQTVSSFKNLDAMARILKVASIQAEDIKKHAKLPADLEGDVGVVDSKHELARIAENRVKSLLECLETSLDLFSEYLLTTDDGKNLAHSSLCIECLFDLFWVERLRNRIMDCIIRLLKTPSSSTENHSGKLLLCSKYLETFTRARERETRFAELSIDLLNGIRTVILADQILYQTLFREGECFLHILSLLNGSLDEETGELLALNVLKTLTSLLSGNVISKAAFTALVGVGYQMLQSLLLDFIRFHPSMKLLDALLDMLVDGNFNAMEFPKIKNEDVIPLLVNVLKKCTGPLQHYGLGIFQTLLRETVPNRTSCCRAGMLTILLDWFLLEEDVDLIFEIAQLIQLIGGHSVNGKDIRKIFALLRNEKIKSKENCYKLLLDSVGIMLREKGPTAFFEFDGSDSGIIIKTPVQWPCSKGFSFTCWIRVENFPEGIMGLFCFQADNGKGCLAMLGRDKLIFEVINQKKQSISLPLTLLSKSWHFLCITHNTGRTFSGGSIVKCYIDGILLSSERCRYPKITDSLTCCTIGMRLSVNIEDVSQLPDEELFPFAGQMGPSYLFNDAISQDQVKAIYFLGPDYMYSFVPKEFPSTFNHMGASDLKDGLTSKIIFSISAQASAGRILFNSSCMDHNMNKKIFEAEVMDGTLICSRRMLKEIIYCVGGVSALFPLLAQLAISDVDCEEKELSSHQKSERNKLVADILDLITSVIEENSANQEQMHLLSGFSVLGFLLQCVSPLQLNMHFFLSLKRMLDVLKESGKSELVTDAISWIYLNPYIWMFAEFNVQRELYMLLASYFESNPSLLIKLRGFPWFLDIIQQFYSEKVDNYSSYGILPHLRSSSKIITTRRLNFDEIHKIRLLLLSLAEMTLRQNISSTDVKALLSFLERSQDLLCIEDVLHMVIRLLSQSSSLSSFLEHVDFLGGCQIFLNLLCRDSEPVRLLALHFLGKLLLGLPSDKKVSRFFSLTIGRPKSFPEIDRKEENIRLHSILNAVSERLLRFPLSENLFATLFDVLLGGASPKQVLQRRDHVQSTKSEIPISSSHFILPHILLLIFKVLGRCEDCTVQEKIMVDLLELLHSKPSNIEAVMEIGWSCWLETSVELYVAQKFQSQDAVSDSEHNEKAEKLVRAVFCVILSHYILAVRGGWQRLEETVNYLLLSFKNGQLPNHRLLQHIFVDLTTGLLEVAQQDAMLLTQPCRDNTLYLLKLLDEMLINENFDKFPFPTGGLSTIVLFSCGQSGSDFASGIEEIMKSECVGDLPRISWNGDASSSSNDSPSADQWVLCENIWRITSEMSGKTARKTQSKDPASGGPSLGQRARGLVESLNIPATEMAAALSGGVGGAFGGRTGKHMDKAMLLRNERCPRIIFHLVLFYLCRGPAEKASAAVQQFCSVLITILSSEDEQLNNRVQLFLWSLANLSSFCETLDDMTRVNTIWLLIIEIINLWKSMIASGTSGVGDTIDILVRKEDPASLLSVLQKEKVIVEVVDEVTYIKNSISERLKQLEDLCMKQKDVSVSEMNQQKIFEEEVVMNTSRTLASDDSRREAYQLAYDEKHQITAERWVHMIRYLSNERGPWCTNPFPNDSVTWWKLDKTEDKLRCRSKLRRNYHFDYGLCLPPSSNQPQSISPVSESPPKISIISDHMKSFLQKEFQGVSGKVDSGIIDNVSETGSTREGINIPISVRATQVPDDKNNGKNVYNVTDFSLTLADTETNEVLQSIPCVLVMMKGKLGGRLALLRNTLYFFSEFLVEGTGGSSAFKHFDKFNASGSEKQDKLTGSHKQKRVPNLDIGSKNAPFLGSPTYTKKFKRHRRWSIHKVKAVHWSRYLLQYTAIEVFFDDSVCPVFFNFASSNDAKQVGMLIVSLRNELSLPRGSTGVKGRSVTFVDRRVAIEMAETARESWRRRELSNFEYLMILNTLAGRSYNDLTQYPIFPWVLADYTSEKLDFNKSSTFRDLRKPVGALDMKRFQVFEDRYHNFCDPEIPSFYYGSHYSSMGIVLFYMIRMEPFTALHRALQGGKFDHADRLFQSIEGTYKNCLSNTSDVKELIPEFFYMPDFLVNSNNYHLGVKQDGEPLSDVSLPLWAKGSPEEFIYQHREALESEFVSSNLHHWVDLIFGYKQRGKPAVEAANVFYYLTYEGAVDLELIEDELQRSAIEDQIANFGQTPIQLFRKKHPRRGPPIPIARPLYFAPSSITLTSIISPPIQFQSPLIFLGLLDSNIVIINKGFILSVKLWLTNQLQSGGSFTFSSSQEPFFGIGPDILSPRKTGSPLAENFQSGRQTFATVKTIAENYLISCGSWDNSFQVSSVHDGRTVQIVRQHKDVVSCVSVSNDGCILATGSFDTTVMVWNVFHGRSNENQVIDPSPFHILCGHDDIVSCIFVSTELDIVISGSKDATCAFHTLREGRYARSIQHPSRSALSKLVVSQSGRVILYSEDDLHLHLYSINGKWLASHESNGRLNCIELSSCGDFLVCAGDHGQITLRSMHSLEIVHRYDAIGKALTSLVVTPEDCFLAGTRDGSLLVYSIENRHIHKANLPRGTS